MKTVLLAGLACAAVLGAVAAFALGLLGGATYDAEAFARFRALQSAVSWSKWIVPIALLVAAARAGVTLGSRRLALLLLLAPLLLFVALSFVDWVLLADGAAAYLRRHGRGSGAATGAAYFMIGAYPAAALLTLGAAAWMLRRRAGR